MFKVQMVRYILLIQFALNENRMFISKPKRAPFRGDKTISLFKYPEVAESSTFVTHASCKSAFNDKAVELVCCLSLCQQS